MNFSSTSGKKWIEKKKRWSSWWISFMLCHTEKEFPPASKNIHDGFYCRLYRPETWRAGFIKLIRFLPGVPHWMPLREFSWHVVRFSVFQSGFSLFRVGRKYKLLAIAMLHSSSTMQNMPRPHVCGNLWVNIRRCRYPSHISDRGCSST